MSIEHLIIADHIVEVEINGRMETVSSLVENMEILFLLMVMM